MIITRTPLRISLVGGGTDMETFYHQSFGAVVSFAINQYIYISVNQKFDGKTKASYMENEVVEDPINLKHDLIRGALSQFQVRGVEITSVSDIPGEGSGLGSSSTFTVGLTLGLMKYTNHPINTHPAYFAEMAYGLEKERCHHVVGKQDHYAAAHGGLYYYQFNPDDTVITEPIHISDDKRYQLEKQLMLFWTGRTREASPILEDQSERFKKGDVWMVNYGEKLRDLAVALKQQLHSGNVDCIGAFLNEDWHLKKKLSHSISTPEIDGLYEKAMNAGATGGKLCGAGGGGFLLMAVKDHRQVDVERALGLRRVPWKMCMKGSMVIYNE